jgi:rare lipoprotein A
MPRMLIRLLMVGAGAASLTACATPRYAIATSPSEGSRTRPYVDPSLKGTMKPYEVNGVWYTPKDQPGYDETGLASWYGYESPNLTTADGEIFNTDAVSAAHKTLPLPSLVEVTNLDNGRTIVVRVNDRGPFVDGRIIDLSRAAAEKLGFKDRGTARVRVRYLGPASALPPTQVAERAPDSSVVATSAETGGARTGTDYGGAIQSSALAPPPAARPPVISAPPAAMSAPAQTWRVQAGAFSTRANADRVASMFATGHVEPMERGGVTLWRVVLGPAPDVAGAEALRDQAAAAGFADATVIGPL